jgi:hypothetical protein
MALILIRIQKLNSEAPGSARAGVWRDLSIPMEAHKATIMGFYAVLASPFCFIQTQTYVYNNHQRQKGGRVGMALNNECLFLFFFLFSLFVPAAQFFGFEPLTTLVLYRHATSTRKSFNIRFRSVLVR